MKHETVKDWRDALVKIAAEKLPDYIVKSPEMYEDTIDIFLPKQDQNKREFMSIEVEPAGKLKRDRIRICVGYRPRRDYETDEQFARNIAKVVAEVHAERDKAEAEERAREAQRQADEERRAILEKVADTAARLAFANHDIKKYYTEGNHTGGKIYLTFPDKKTPEGFNWYRELILEYTADADNNITWEIGKGTRVYIPDLATFAKTIS